ncbi:MAG: Sec-independent protein translocase subunit TatA/TatB [Planctomycetaceae bacterium]
MFGLSPPEIMAVAVIAILLFGSKLPEVARSLGGSYRELRRGLNDMQQQFREVEREVTRAIDAPATNKSLVSVEEDEVDSEPAAPKFVPPPAPDASTPTGT